MFPTWVLMFAIAIILLVAIFYVYRKFYALRFFEREGIPGPKPHWLFGNVLAFGDESKRHLVHAQWTRQFGNLYGYFEGSLPTLVTSDVDLINQVFVKQFHNFHRRKEGPVLPDPDDFSGTMMLFSACGERWKRIRTIVNPMFSTGKMRGLMPLLKKCQTDFMELIDKKADDEFDIYQCCQFLTLDSISETAFGLELNSARNEDRNNSLLKTMTSFFDLLFKISLPMQLASIFTEISPIFSLFEIFRGKFLASGIYGPRYHLFELMNNVVKMRQQDGNKRQDLLQMLLDAQNDSFVGPKSLTKAEVVAQAVLFMIAGFETTSNALAFTFFLLANNQRVQDKLIAEIDGSHVGGDLDHDVIYRLEYLDCVVNEALRLFPVALLIVNRQSEEETVINGVRIPRGLAVHADVWAVHHDEDQWGPVNPDLFYPERFQSDYPSQPTRSAAAFLPFGFGPRICIGMRFALLEMKLTLVNLLQKYRIEKTSRTGDEMKLRVNFTITPKDGVWIKLAKLN